ncbi:TetR family transcriptional regulator [Plantibacter flavus]|uniref:TetR family transcriptional regulator n=1 Tax=Plantibacter flavus TaxID=150123 RepID=UPI003F1698F2
MSTADQTPRIDGRRSRGERTRRAVVEAAIGRFEEDGYNGASISSIAAAAGVGEQTVYYGFGSKREILAAALDLATAGADADTPFVERGWVVSAISAPTALEQLQHQVRGAEAVLERSGALLDVVRSAASTDPAIAALWRDNLAQRRHAQLVFARALDSRGALHPELTTSLAADLALAATSPESWWLLRRERGLGREAWIRWTTAALAGALLARAE